MTGASRIATRVSRAGGRSESWIAGVRSLLAKIVRAMVHVKNIFHRGEELRRRPLWHAPSLL